MSNLSDLLDFDLSDTDGFPQLRCRLDPANLDAAAGALADAIAYQRIGVNRRRHQLWRSRRLNPSETPIEESDLQILKAGLLQNVGTPDQPAQDNHLHGLVAEAIWHEVVSNIDAGLGYPLRVEGHAWSVTDPGGDGLTVYEIAARGYCFRLWESKHHGTGNPVRETVNRACQQVKSQSLSYLARFSLVAQRRDDDKALARFYGSLADLWVDRDPAAGVGISVGTGSDVDADDCFDRVTDYFDFDPSQHQAQLHLMGEFGELARRVRVQLWKGCGLWTEP
ncbi:hypothetical protein [Candidatus Poriferisocius sp.]|uniref:hypothetical protein n=1 Tax=Candidatus Poriferisocius sp. TaxID=3101276 RepID=UPI003B021AD8